MHAHTHTPVHTPPPVVSSRLCPHPSQTSAHTLGHRHTLSCCHHVHTHLGHAWFTYFPPCSLHPLVLLFAGPSVHTHEQHSCTCRHTRIISCTCSLVYTPLWFGTLMHLGALSRVCSFILVCTLSHTPALHAGTHNPEDAKGSH